MFLCASLLTARSMKMLMILAGLNECIDNFEGGVAG